MACEDASCSMLLGEIKRRFLDDTRKACSGFQDIKMERYWSEGDAVENEVDDPFQLIG